MRPKLASPALQSPPAVAGAGTSPFPGAKSPIASLGRILYAEDDLEAHPLWSLTLTRAGYSVKLEEDGLRAWDSLRSGEFDMLVTDNDMPGMTGLELAAKARLEGMRLPIILASGSIHLLDVADYGWLDFATLLKKPFSPDRLIEAVAKALCSSSGESRGAGVPALA